MEEMTCLNVHRVLFYLQRNITARLLEVSTEGKGVGNLRERSVVVGLADARYA